MKHVDNQLKNINKQPRRYSFVACDIFGDASLETCVQCKYKVEISLSAVNCGYKK